MAKANELSKALRAGGARITRQRSVLLDILAEAPDHPDANELHSRARRIDPSVSLSTVYRTLAALELQGLVQRHAFDKAAARFERADTPRHGHLIDLEGGEIIEFRSTEIETLQQQIAASYGYKIVHRKLELYCLKKLA